MSPAVAADTVWALDKSRTFVVLQGTVTLDVDASAYFSSDRIGIRVTLRAATGFAHGEQISVATDYWVLYQALYQPGKPDPLPCEAVRLGRDVSLPR